MVLYGIALYCIVCLPIYTGIIVHTTEKARLNSADVPIMYCSSPDMGGNPACSLQTERVSGSGQLLDRPAPKPREKGTHAPKSPKLAGALPRKGRSGEGL